MGALFFDTVSLVLSVSAKVSLLWFKYISFWLLNIWSMLLASNYDSSVSLIWIFSLSMTFIFNLWYLIICIRYFIFLLFISSSISSFESWSYIFFLMHPISKYLLLAFYMVYWDFQRILHICLNFPQCFCLFIELCFYQIKQILDCLNHFF